MFTPSAQVLCLSWEQEQVTFVCHSSNIESNKKSHRREKNEQDVLFTRRQCKSTSFLGFSVIEI